MGESFCVMVSNVIFTLEVQDQTKWLVFWMIHVKDSLPMGKVWSAWTPWVYFTFKEMIRFDEQVSSQLRLPPKK